MKRLLLVITISVMSLSSFAQEHNSNVISTFQKAKDADTTVVSGAVSGSTTSGTTTTIENCQDNVQKTLPLDFIHSLINQKIDGDILSQENSQLIIGNSDLTFTANCQDMLKVEVVHPDEHDGDDFLVRFGFNQSEDICSNGKCKYKVLGADDAEFEPNYNGFLECLAHSGVIEIDRTETDFSKNKVKITKYNKENEVRREFNFKIPVRDQAGNVHFSSIGPLAQGNPVYKKIRSNPQSCEYVEEMVKGDYRLLSSTEVKSHENYLEFAKLCKNGDYRGLLDNSDKLSEFKQQIEYVVKQGVLKDYKDVAKKINKAKTKDDLSDSDLEVISLMKSQVIDPILNKIEMYGDLYENEDDKEKKKEYKKKLKELKKELNKYTSSPYVTKKTKKKLINLGLIEESKPIALTLIAKDIYKRVGASSKSITGTEARVAMSKAAEAYEEVIKKQKKTDERKNCENEDELKEYTIKVALHTKALQTIDQRTQKNINDAIAEMQKKCFVYYRNQRRCIQQYTDGINACKKRRLKAKTILRKRLKEAQTELAEIKKYAKACDKVDVDEDDLDEEETLADILDPDYLEVDVDTSGDVNLNNGQGYTWRNQSNGFQGNQGYQFNQNGNWNGGVNTGWNTNGNWNSGNTGWFNGGNQFSGNQFTGNFNGNGNIPWRLGNGNNGVNFGYSNYFGTQQPPFATPGINGNANFGANNYFLGGGPNRYNFNYGNF